MGNRGGRHQLRVLPVEDRIFLLVGIQAGGGRGGEREGGLGAEGKVRTGGGLRRASANWGRHQKLQAMHSILSRFANNVLLGGGGGLGLGLEFKESSNLDITL